MFKSRIWILIKILSSINGKLEMRDLLWEIRDIISYESKVQFDFQNRSKPS